MNAFQRCSRGDKCEKQRYKETSQLGDMLRKRKNVSRRKWFKNSIKRMKLQKVSKNINNYFF
jgi:hypothetical protein